MSHTGKITYLNPPVIETVLGIQFDRIPGIRNGHLGAFWKTLDTAEWPHIADVVPLQSQFERFTEQERWAAQFLFKVTDDAACRMQIRNVAQDQMIQAQNTRLHLNWMKKSEPYPRFDAMRDKFTDLWERFSEFVRRNELGELKLNQWEVTYVNEIHRGTVWNSPADWSFFRPLASITPIEGIVEPESFDGEWHFAIPERRGRLHVSWQHNKDDGKDFIRVTLTARGHISETGTVHVLSGLQLGRDTIVHSFRHLMDDSANKFWGLIDDC